jgi:hypothetical protein
MPINYDTLHKLYSLRPVAHALFGAIVEAGVDQGRTTVDELIEGSGATRRQAITILRELDEAGCGEFKVGRKGHPSRLVWIGDPREIATRVVSSEGLDAIAEQQAIEAPSQTQINADTLEQIEVGSTDGPADAPALKLAPDLPESLAETRNPPLAPARRARPVNRDHASGEPIDHSYVLRPSTRVSLTLPADLTQREAEVLADWIRNLSFER